MERVEQVTCERNNSIALSAILNKNEFDAHKCEFLSKCSSQQCASTSQKPPSVGGTNLPSRGSSRSKASSSSTVKRRAAEAEFIAAQIRAEQAKERAEEEFQQQLMQVQLEQRQQEMQLQLKQQQQQKSQREAQRELEVAAAKLQVWDQSDEKSESSPRTVRKPAPIKPMVESTIPSSFSSNSLPNFSMNPNIPTENMAGQCATQDQMPSVGELNSIVTAVNAPLTTTENRRVSFSECSLTRPKSEQSVHAGDNFLCRPTSVYANETTAHSRIVGSSERPLKLTSTQNYHNNGGPRYSVEDNWNPRNYYRPNLRPNMSQARQPPGFASFAPYPYNVSYDELFLPRPEFKKFNGNPLEFRSFISNFETHVEPRVHDNTMLFCLLLQHCEDKIKSKIEHYADRGTFAYRLAKDRLQREYGRECLIADMCEQNLINAPSVNNNDPEGLKHYSEILEKALITLQGLSTFGSVNSLDSMT